ncbi:amino acid deaminase [Rhodoferax sp.]|uniref:amino acid deaminase n=1 Tax=Rhodoferax sp. TaxID=50421 RepID=UPI0027306133|nr:amino acid deaminase [Rhodoferax sp.]MDP1529881.1 amino acid deaminase [Rhodoferax sp.]MDP1944573.1 amino acid deaminase [Rhodoferax sp.]MDP2440642.1 amino acid deaminase [Rhodoferax sp.]MDZ4208931.1 amino acid deaminase [Rhodoferax sp.]
MTPDFTLDHSFKSYPFNAAPCRASELAGKGWNLLADDLPFPLAVIHRSALLHNVAWMQDYARRKGVALAPHGKTTMSPQLFQMQLAGGAWGMSFATLYQVAVGVEAGARRIIIANQVVCDADFDALATLLARHPDLRVWFLVDSVAQLTLIEDWASRRAATTPFDVLLEMGIPGQRTGCRTLAEALHLAQKLAASRVVRFGGIECYEGGVATCESAHDVREVTALVHRVTEVVKACDQQNLFEGDELLITAGGSAVFDLVIPLLRLQDMQRPMLGVLRSGCYITHDHGNYARFLRLVEQREGLDASLRPALEVWAMVQSVPEPGLALLTCGRRDVSYDLEMPLPQRHAARASRQANAVPADWKISALNDQHAYLRFDPAGLIPQVGDRVSLGISHPCTTFDKWRWLPLVEDDGAITSAVATRF